MLEDLKKTSLDNSYLPTGYKIHWYTIQKVLGRGGFGITYLAIDSNLDRPVAIKEYLPGQFSSRNQNFTVRPKAGEGGVLYAWGLDRFLSEAQTLAKFEHPNIVQVQSVFELNNTSYMVMKFEEGTDLSRYVAKYCACDQQMLLNMVLPILNGLQLVHAAGFIHRDIKPANIYIRADSSPVLLDFGSAREFLTGQTSNMTRLISHSYTPFEQYNEAHGKQGAWTDIYSLGATLYFCVSGELPVDAMARGASILEHGQDNYVPLSASHRPGYSDAFLACIDWALEFRQQDRPQTCESWAAALRNSGLNPGLHDVPVDAGDDKTRVMPISQRVGTSSPAPTSGVGSISISVTTKDIQPPPEAPAADQTAQHKSSGSRILMLTALLLVSVLLFFGLVFLDREYSDAPDIGQLLVEAEADLRASRLITPESSNAYDRYRAVLAVDPTNTKALEGLASAEKQLEKKLLDLLRDYRFTEVDKLLIVLAGFAEERVSAKQLLNRIALRKTEFESQSLLDKELHAAMTQLEQGIVFEPEGRGVLQKLQRLAKENPLDSRVSETLGLVVSEAVLQINESISARNLVQAEDHLKVLSHLGFESRAIADLHKKLLAERSSQQTENQARQEAQRQEAQRQEAQRQEAQRQEAAKKKSSLDTASARSEASNAVTTMDRQRLELLRKQQSGQSSKTIIGRKIRSFVKALSTMDIAYLKSETQLSAETRHKIEGLAKIYSVSDVKVLNVFVSENQESATAELSIEKLFAENGRTMVPGPKIGLYTLTLKQVEGVWSDILW